MIRLYNVHKQYGQHVALRDVSFTVSKGDFCYITGPSGAGKTTMLEQMKAIFLGIMPASKIPPTVGLNIGRMQVNRAKLILWDLGGQTSLRAIWEKYYAEAHGLIYVVDASDPDRFEESRAVLQQLLSHPDLTGIPLLVFANKQDLPNAMGAAEVTEKLGLHALRQRWFLQSACAVNGDGLYEGLDWLSSQPLRGWLSP